MLATSYRSWQATGLVVGSCLSIQVGSALAASLITSVGSTGAMLLRLSLATVILFILCRPKLSTWSHSRRMAAIYMGVSMALMNGCFYMALARIPLAAAVTLEFVGPLTMSAVLSRNPRDVLAVGWAMAGIALLGGGHSITSEGLDPVGITWALIAGAFWVLYILAAARAGSEISGIEGVAVATAVGSLVALPFGAYGASLALFDSHILGLAILTAILASVVPYSFEFLAIRELSAKTFGVLLSLEPAVAALVGWVVLGQSISWTSILGIVMVVMASVGSR